MGEYKLFYAGFVIDFSLVFLCWFFDKGDEARSMKQKVMHVVKGGNMCGDFYAALFGFFQRQ